MDYQLLAKQLRSFLEEEPFFIPALSNASALLKEALQEVNWAGFYLMKDKRLVLGPFQGKPACIHIEIGKGVCGTAVQKDKTMLVSDVHEFPGHIACDSASNSEIVVPIHQDGKIIGVLDIDSPIKNRFTKEDQEGLELFVRELERGLEF